MIQLWLTSLQSSNLFNTLSRERFYKETTMSHLVYSSCYDKYWNMANLYNTKKFAANIPRRNWTSKVMVTVVSAFAEDDTSQKAPYHSPWKQKKYAKKKYANSHRPFWQWSHSLPWGPSCQGLSAFQRYHLLILSLWGGLNIWIWVGYRCSNHNNGSLR